MRFPSILIFLLFLNSTIFGQHVDSLLAVLNKNSAIDTAKVNTLNALGRAYWTSGEDSIAISFHNRAIATAKKLKYYKGEANARLALVRIELEYLSDLAPAYRHLDSVLILSKLSNDRLLEGQAYFRRAQIYSSGIFDNQKDVKPLYERARKIFVELGDKVMEGSVYAELAELEGTKGRYAEAVELLIRARKLQEASGQLTALRATLPNLGVMYLKMGMYDQALKCFDDAEKTAIKLKDERVKAFIYSQRGDIQKIRKNLDGALNSYLKAAKIYEISQVSSILPGVYAKISEIYFLQNKLDLALDFNTRADTMYKNQTDANNSLLHRAQTNFGRIYLKKGQYDKVIGYAREGLEWAETSDPVLLAEATEYHSQLAEALEKKGNLREAFQHYKVYKANSDTLLNDESRQKITVASMNYDFEKKQQASKLRIQELENDKLLRTRNFLIGLSLLGIIGMAYVLWSNRKLRGKNEQLSQKNQEIERALHKGQRIERKRVASELHDNLNTKLAAIRWNMEAMRSEEFDPFNAKIHSRLLEMTSDVYKDVRLISHNMLPEELETEGLVSALQKLVGKLENTDSTQFNLIVNGLEKRLPEKIELQLYNITLELVNNVLKHAKASKVWISLSSDGAQTVLSVIDDGVGMPENVVFEGMGMGNLKARVESLNGRFEVKSPDTGGTSVIIQIPG